jgi:hypothetical protein
MMCGGMILNLIKGVVVVRGTKNLTDQVKGKG